MKLTAELEQKISEKVSSGRFESPEDVVRFGLQLIEQKEREEGKDADSLRHSLAQASEDIEQGKGIPAQLVFLEIQDMSRTQRAVAKQ